jgi:hypothetical protein
MKAHFYTIWAQLRGRDQCMRMSRTGSGSQTLGILRGGGLFSKAPLHILEMRGWDPIATPLMKGIVTEIVDLLRLTVLDA